MTGAVGSRRLSDGRRQKSDTRLDQSLGWASRIRPYSSTLLAIEGADSLVDSQDVLALSVASPDLPTFCCCRRNVNA